MYWDARLFVGPRGFPGVESERHKHTDDDDSDDTDGDGVFLRLRATSLALVALAAALDARDVAAVVRGVVRSLDAHLPAIIIDRRARVASLVFGREVIPLDRLKGVSKFGHKWARWAGAGYVAGALPHCLIIVLLSELRPPFYHYGYRIFSYARPIIRAAAAVPPWEKALAVTGESATSEAPGPRASPVGALGRDVSQ